MSSACERTRESRVPHPPLRFFPPNVAENVRNCEVAERLIHWKCAFFSSESGVSEDEDGWVGVDSLDVK